MGLGFFSLSSSDDLDCTFHKTIALSIEINGCVLLEILILSKYFEFICFEFSTIVTDDRFGMPNFGNMVLRCMITVGDSMSVRE